MSLENIPFAAICWFISLIFVMVALWAFKRKDPMHFWSGTTVKHEEISDTPSYNRANGIMWAIYAACMIVTGIVSLFSSSIGAILLGTICVPGIIVLIIAYNRIYNKYRNKSVIYKADNSSPKVPKPVICMISLISATILILVGMLFFYGEKDAEVNILDNRIQIKAMYGLDIDFSEITEISLIEKSMGDIGLGSRVNGYHGIGDARKGNFKSDSLGNAFLFVQSKSSPTIKIERTNRKDVYISFRNSENTKRLYSQLMAAIITN